MSHDNSDDRLLRVSVVQALSTNARTASLGLRVGVLNGVAHLAGTAPSQALWRLAAGVAATVPGMRGIVNRVAAPGAPRPSRVINLPLEVPQEIPE